jgi:WD40 repeat protein
VTGTLLNSLEGGASAIRALRISPDGKILVSGSADNLIRFWGVPHGRLVRTLEGHRDWITDLDFSPDGQFLASASKDANICIWDVTQHFSILGMTSHPY